MHIDLYFSNITNIGISEDRCATGDFHNLTHTTLELVKLILSNNEFDFLECSSKGKARSKTGYQWSAFACERIFNALLWTMPVGNKMEYLHDLYQKYKEAFMLTTWFLKTVERATE